MGRSQWTTELRGSALMFPKSRVESVSSSISPITALKYNQKSVILMMRNDGMGGLIDREINR